MNLKQKLSWLTLSTPQSRIGIWALLTIGIWAAPFSWLGQLSLYGRLGLDSAPSIGLTRSYWYVLHGDFTDAWHMNYLIFVVLAIGLPLLALDILKLIKWNAKV